MTLRNVVPRFSPEARKANQALVDLIGKIAAAKRGDAGADRARMAARTRAVDRADPGHHQAASSGENLGGADVALSAADLGEIARAVSGVEVQGARYPEHLQALVGS